MFSGYPGKLYMENDKKKKKKEESKIIPLFFCKSNWKLSFPTMGKYVGGEMA